MPGASTLQRILDPLSVEEFVAKYFQRHWFRLRGPANKFDFLFQEREFAVGLGRVKHIRAFFEGNRQAHIHAKDIPHMYEAGATICVTGMERAHPKLLRAARRIKSELRYPGPVSFRAYLSPPGSGFDIHYDARVVTTLQITGTKRWWISTEPAVRFPTHNSGRGPAGSTPPRPALDQLHRVVVRPGDVFCLPAGTWHCAEAQGSEMSLALNLAFDHNGGGALDSVVAMLRDRLGEDPAWREPLPVAPGASGRQIPERVASALRDRIDALQSELARIRDDERELTRAWLTALRSNNLTEPLG